MSVKVLEEIKNGNIVIVPTDTVPGLAVDATNGEAIEKIYEIKKREPRKKIPLLFSSTEQIEKYLEMTNEERKIGEKFWPGGLTLVLKSKGQLPQILENDAGKVGARIPANEDVRAFIEELGKPIAATSINISGEPSITKTDSIPAEITENIAGILAGNYESLGMSSTVAEINNDEVIIYREGPISADEIKQHLLSL